jgi:hypothetical protein
MTDTDWRLLPAERWALAAGLAVLWLPFLVYALVAGDDHLVRFFPDDAFYYLQPAWNWARHGTPTFDGVHFTNGYHPLNFVLVTALALGTTKSSLLSVTFAAHSLLALGGSALAAAYFGTRRRLLVTWTAFVVLASPALMLFVHLSAGLEAGLVVACTALLFISLQAALRAGCESVRHNLALGLSAALVLLARLDTIIPVAIVMTGFLGILVTKDCARTQWPARLRSAAATVVVPLVSLSGYLLVNWVTTGHLVPISGTVKRAAAFGAHSWNASTRGTPAGFAIALLPMAISVVTMVVAARRIRGRGEPDGEDHAMLLGSLGNLAFYAYLAVGVENVFRWYFAFPIGCALVGATYLVRLAADGPSPRASRRWPVTGMAALVGAGVVLNVACLVWIGTRTASTSYQLKHVSELVNRWGGDRSVTATLDAGVIGFFASGRVINLDGLANDFEYLEQYLRTGRVGEYLHREGVTHVLVRDSILANADEVARGEYRLAHVTLAPALVLSKDQELFRYEIPGQFTLYYFRVPPFFANASPAE